MKTSTNWMTCVLSNNIEADLPDTLNNRQAVKEVRSTWTQTFENGKVVHCSKPKRKIEIRFQTSPFSREKTFGYRNTLKTVQEVIAECQNKFGKGIWFSVYVDDKEINDYHYEEPKYHFPAGR